MELEYKTGCVYAVVLQVSYEDQCFQAVVVDFTKELFLSESDANAYADWCNKEIPDASLWDEDDELDYRVVIYSLASLKGR